MMNSLQLLYQLKAIPPPRDILFFLRDTLPCYWCYWGTHPSRHAPQKIAWGSRVHRFQAQGNMSERCKIEVFFYIYIAEEDTALAKSSLSARMFCRLCYSSKTTIIMYWFMSRRRAPAFYTDHSSYTTNTSNTDNAHFWMVRCREKCQSASCRSPTT